MENNEKTKKNSSDASATIVNDKKHEKAIVNTILIILSAGLFVITFGIAWAIGDVFSKDKFNNWVNNSSLQFKLFSIGLIVVLTFILLIFLVVLYRRRRVPITNALFKEKTTTELKEGEEYLPAKIITVGALISIFMIFIGLVTAFLEYIFSSPDTSNPLYFLTTLDEFSRGLVVLIGGVLILVLDGLIFGFVYIWLNGQYAVINNILKYNLKATQKRDFTKGEKLTGQIIFGLIIAELISVVIGIIWALLDAALGNWKTTFSGYKIGFKISFYGVFFAFLFVGLIGAMFLYKRGLNLIMSSLFVKVTVAPEEEKKSMAKFITLGILIGICLIAGSLILWLIIIIVQAFSTSGTSGNIFTTLAGLSGGLACLAYGILAAIFTILALIFSFFLHNGYYWVMIRILKIEKGIDKGMEMSEQKVQAKKKERKMKKSEQKNK
ncbi:MAG: hypothetical protein ACTSVU_08385 [Promethearchaeota archaeon]